MRLYRLGGRKESRAASIRTEDSATCSERSAVLVGRLIEGGPHLFAGGVEVFVEIFAGAFCTGFYVLRGDLCVMPHLVGGLPGLFAGALVVRRGAGSKCEGESDCKGWFHTPEWSNSRANALMAAH